MPEEKSFKKKVIDSFLWLGTGTFFGQIISWIATIVVIRLLIPSVYGLMAMATTFISLLVTIGELGIGASIIQAEILHENDIRDIFGIFIITSIIGFLICFFTAPLIAAFYNDPRLVLIIRVMASMFILLSLYAIPEALMIREMDFKMKAKIDIAAQIVGSLSTLLLALTGFGVWSLVNGFLSVNMVKAIGYNLSYKKWLKPSFNYQNIKRFIKYGMSVTVSRVIYGLFTEADKIIAGRFLGNVNLGIYAVASNLSSIPAEKVLPIITQVTFTSYSRIQTDTARIRRNIVRTIKAIAYSGFPLFFGMAAVAPDVVPWLLGPKWTNIVVYFQLFCLVMPLKALSPILPPAIFALGKPNVNLTNMLMNLIVMSLAFLLGVRFGVIGICMAWVIVYPFLFIINSIRCLHVIEMPFREYIQEMIFPFIASIVMILFIFLVKNIIWKMQPAFSVIIMVISGSIMYFFLVFAFKKIDIPELKSYLNIS